MISNFRDSPSSPAAASSDRMPYRLNSPQQKIEELQENTWTRGEPGL
jgi:hypothetical protein